MNGTSGQWIGTAVTVLISAAALGSSWAGYEAALWSGKQAAFGNEAISLRTRSTRASTLAGQLRAIDVALFTSWLAAYANGDTVLERAADSAATASGAANRHSDGYVLDVVILATLMFFASTANQPGNPRLRGALLVMALLFLVAGAYRLLTSPRG